MDLIFIQRTVCGNSALPLQPVPLLPVTRVLENPFLELYRPHALPPGSAKPCPARWEKIRYMVAVIAPVKDLCPVHPLSPHTDSVNLECISTRVSDGRFQSWVYNHT